MAKERVQRCLTAILAADLVVYSRLTGEYEEGGRVRFNAHRTKLIEYRMAVVRGRVVQTTGDGLLWFR